MRHTGQPAAGAMGTGSRPVPVAASRSAPVATGRRTLADATRPALVDTTRRATVVARRALFDATRATRIAATLGLGTAALVLASPGVALAATVTVSPGTVPPGGTVTVTVTGGCREGSDINIAGPGSSTRPDVVSKLGPGGQGSVTVPRNGRSGTWSVWVFCEDDLTPRTAFVVSPAGRPATGDGATAGGPDPGLVTAGGGALALAAAGGLVLLRRRQTA